MRSKCFVNTYPNPSSKCCCFDVQVCSLRDAIVLLEKSWKLFEKLKVFENIKLHSKDFD
jgi:hypothetical protein